MALFGITRSEYESMSKDLIDHERSEATRLDHEAERWDGKAEAYGNILSTTVISGWGYYLRDTAPSKSCQENAQICRHNAKVYRIQAQAHRDKAAEYDRNRVTVLAAGQFDHEGRYDS